MSDEIVIKVTPIEGSTPELLYRAAAEIERLTKQRDELAWAIAWFLNGGSREKLEARFKAYEETL